MRWTKGRIALLSLVVVGLAGWQLFSRYFYYLPGLVESFRDPLQSHRPIAWNRGPDTAARTASERPPNIIVILADDLGWNDVTFNGGGVAGGSVPTPRIDSIARDGVSFMQGYAGNATCAPSRAAIMTGRYATRFGFEFTPTPKQFSRLVASYKLAGTTPGHYHADREKDFPKNINDLVVPQSEVMIGQALKSRGYHTVMLGKWHLGGTETARPSARGFDEALAFHEGAAMFLPENDPRVVNSKQEFDPIDKFLWANLRHAIRYNGGPSFQPDLYMTDYLGREAARAIEANRNRPFMMYLAYNAPHTPLQALKSDYDALAHIADHRLRVYGAMIRALDRSVGVVLDALKAQGLEDNTLVIFSSDNGGANYVGLPDLNKPFRGWKATFFEGGLRVPYFMKWPARIPAGVRYEKPIGHVDIFTTAVAAAEAAVPSDRTIDGVNLVPYVTGARTGEPHKALYWRSGHYKVVLSGNWKLQVSERPNKVWLFDLSTDPLEKNDLSRSHPAKLEELRKALAEIDGQQVPPSFPSLMEAPVLIDKPLNVEVRPDDELVFWAN
ncbi:MAG TPA: sulfatase-like hydrolase/transferase [Beijerinckiaceae bacterium]|nr:sulfatase-like hydrolase/transferase [Beijerinckiaceae bacterium]